MRYLTWALSLVPVVLLFAAAGISHMTYDVPEGGYNGHLGTLPPGYAKPDNVPDWADEFLAEHPDCGHEGGAPDHVLAMDYDGVLLELPIDIAFERIENDTWVDDIWIVGACQ